jgi:hypothetical protein
MFVLLLKITETGLPGTGRGKLSSSYHGWVLLQRFVLLLEITETGLLGTGRGETALLPPCTGSSKVCPPTRDNRDRTTGNWKRETVLLLPWTGSSKVCPPTRDNRDRISGHWKRESVLLPPWTGSLKVCPPTRDNRDRSTRNWKRETMLLPKWTGSSKVCPPTRDNRDRSLGTGRGKLSSSYHGRVLQRFVLLLEITEIGLLGTGWTGSSKACSPTRDNRDRTTGNLMDGFFKGLSSY